MDTRELYQQVILDHNKSPKNYKKLEEATHSAVGHNPLCGDEIRITVQVDDGIVQDIGFEGAGCAISQASASMMTAAVKGRTLDDAIELVDKFRHMVTGSLDEAPDRKEMGRLVALGGVREFPARIKCASLSWHTLLAALTRESETVVTEE